MPALAIRLAPMTLEMYQRYAQEYENDPDLYLDPGKYVHYEYSSERAELYFQRQIDRGRILLAILSGTEIVGEIVIKNIEPHVCATMGLTLKNASWKDRGIGTAAEKLAVAYVFNELDIPTLYADSIQPNTRSQHVLEKVGFTFIREDESFKYYRIDRAGKQDVSRETIVSEAKVIHDRIDPAGETIALDYRMDRPEGGQHDSYSAV